jgi:hypothetical protein
MVNNFPYLSRIMCRNYCAGKWWQLTFFDDFLYSVLGVRELGETENCGYLLGAEILAGVADVGGSALVLVGSHCGPGL